MADRTDPPVAALLKDAGLVGERVWAEPRRPAPGHPRGVALIAVLWGLAIIALLLAAFLATSRTEIRLAANLRDAAAAEALAESGIARAVLGRLDPEPARRWRADGTLYRLTEQGGDLEIVLVAESGKVDLNEASPQLLAALMRGLGIDPDRADALTRAIVAFRSVPDDTGPAADAAETAGALSAPKHATFDAIEELQQVAGVTPAIYARLRPFVTVFGSAGIQPIFAAPAVLRAIPGMDEGELTAFLTARAANHWGEAAGPDSNDAVLSDDEAPSGSAGEQTQDTQDPSNTIAEDAENRTLSEADQLSVAAQYGRRFREALPKSNGVLAFFDLGAAATLIDVTVRAHTSQGAAFTRDAVINLTPSGEGAYSVVTWSRGADESAAR